MRTKDIKIYSAGKTWSAHWYRALKKSFNICARWIDIQDVLASPDDIFPDEIHENEEYKREVWENGCKVDCATSDLMVMACHPDDGNNHSGSLVELGHVTGEGKPCYIIGTCESVQPVGNSDRAWKSQSIVHHWPDIDVTDPLQLESAFSAIISHYKNNYSDQWIANNS